MDKNSMDALKGLLTYGESLDSLTRSLAEMYPNVPFLAWQEALFVAQNDYRSPEEKAADLRLKIAVHWLELAKAKCLDVRFDPSKGWVVKEKMPVQVIMQKDIEKLLLMLLRGLPEGRLLQYHEIQAAFLKATRQSLSDYLEEFGDLVSNLTEKRYIVWDDTGGRKLPRFGRGLDFDEWTEMMSKPPSASAGPIFNFHAPVGAVQTGDNSTANVQQVTELNGSQQLQSALQAAQEEFAKANIPQQEREDVRDYLQSIINELQKEKPNRFSLKSLLSNVATTVQTLGASSEAYKAVIAALGLLGFS